MPRLIGDMSFAKRLLSVYVNVGLPMFCIMWLLSYRPFTWEGFFVSVLAYGIAAPLICAVILHAGVRIVSAAKSRDR